MAAANPLLPGAPPAYVHGMPGGAQVWRYRGREISVQPGPTGTWWEASWTEGTDRESHHAVDAQDAVGRARFNIDLIELGGDWPEAEIGLVHASDHLDEAGRAATRATLARHAEVLFRQALTGTDVSPIRKWHAEAFYRLSLSDRLRLIDEVIADQRRAGVLSNPSSPSPRGMQTRAALLAWGR